MRDTFTTRYAAYAVSWLTTYGRNYYGNTEQVNRMLTDMVLQGPKNALKTLSTDDKELWQKIAYDYIHWRIWR